MFNAEQITLKYSISNFTNKQKIAQKFNFSNVDLNKCMFDKKTKSSFSTLTIFCIIHIMNL